MSNSGRDYSERTFMTDRSRKLIRDALRTKLVPDENGGMRPANQTDLAKAAGQGRDWVSKLLNGERKSISPNDADVINDFLGIDVAGNRSNEDLAHPGIPTHIPMVHQKELIKIGAKITRIVHIWEQGGDPHYAKIAAEVLDFLRDHLPTARR